MNKSEVMTGIALMFFFQGLGGAIWLTVAQTIFAHSLVSGLEGVAGLDPSLIINSGATELRDLVPAQFLPKVLSAYNAALSDTFKLSVACGAATVIAGLVMEWKSVKGLKEGGDQSEKAAPAVKAEDSV